MLRQPYARKTGIRELDECYVFTFRDRAGEVINAIKSGLESEGLGDIAGRVVSDTDPSSNPVPTRETNYREPFRAFEGRIYLPRFVMQERDSWRDVNFDRDILSRIDWSEINLSPLNDIALSKQNQNGLRVGIGFGENGESLFTEDEREELQTTWTIDAAFMTRQLVGVVPNPWLCFDIVQQALKAFGERYTAEIIAFNSVFIIEELKKELQRQRDILAEKVFRDLVDKKTLCFFLLTEKGGFRLPSRISVRSERQMVRHDNSPIQKSLFDYVPVEAVNELERDVAVYMDSQEKLLWWYRNMSRHDYHIQGWKRNKIYPDFLATDTDKQKPGQYDTVYVIETKGLHLKNEDTTYKQDVFKLCNELGARRAWKELDLDFPNQKFNFQVLFENEWKSKLNSTFQN